MVAFHSALLLMILCISPREGRLVPEWWLLKLVCHGAFIQDVNTSRQKSPSLPSLVSAHRALALRLRRSRGREVACTSKRPLARWEHPQLLGPGCLKFSFIYIYIYFCHGLFTFSFLSSFLPVCVPFSCLNKGSPYSWHVVLECLKAHDIPILKFSSTYYRMKIHWLCQNNYQIRQFLQPSQNRFGWDCLTKGTHQWMVGYVDTPQITMSAPLQPLPDLKPSATWWSGWPSTPFRRVGQTSVWMSPADWEPPKAETKTGWFNLLVWV